MMRRIYVVVRTDLPVHAITPQACHAVAELGRSGLIRDDEDHPVIVVLGVESLDALRRLRVRLGHWGIRCRMWVEEDLKNEETALATEAIDGKMTKAFADLKLIGAPERDSHHFNASESKDSAPPFNARSCQPA